MGHERRPFKLTLITYSLGPGSDHHADTVLDLESVVDLSSDLVSAINYLDDFGQVTYFLVSLSAK